MTVKGEGLVNEEGAVLVTDVLTVESALENAGTINLKKDLDVSASASYVQTGGSVLAPTLTNKGSFALEGGSAALIRCRWPLLQKSAATDSSLRILFRRTESSRT